MISVKSPEVATVGSEEFCDRCGDPLEEDEDFICEDCIEEMEEEEDGLGTAY
jgi:predicted amidophosphoribosyltransferase